MPQGFAQLDFVTVSTSDFRDRQKTGFDQLGHDLLHHPLCDPYQHRDFAQSDLGVLIEAKQHVGVIRQERPAGDPSWRCVHRRRAEILDFAFSALFHRCGSCAEL